MISRFCVALVLGMFVFFALPAQSATVITSPPVFDSSYSYLSGLPPSPSPDTVGGTFTAAEDTLVSFSLFLGVVGGTQSNEIQAVVLATDGSGAPIGTPIWSSNPFEAIGTPSEVNFNPDIMLTLGEQYFIGVDTGIYNTGLAGGDITVQYAPIFSGDTNPGGSYWTNSNGTVAGPFLETDFQDIATTIVLGSLIPTPEPNTFLLVSLGLVGLSAMRKNRR